MFGAQPIIHLEIDVEGHAGIYGLYHLHQGFSLESILSIQHDIISGQPVLRDVEGSARTLTWQFNDGSWAAMLDSREDPQLLGLSGYLFDYTKLEGRIIGVLAFGENKSDVLRHYFELTQGLEYVSDLPVQTVPFDPFTFEQIARRIGALVYRNAIGSLDIKFLPDAVRQEADPLMGKYLEYLQEGDAIRVSIADLDMTSEIEYVDGTAVLVRSFTLWNRSYKTRSEYARLPDGSYTEWHQDPEHGGWPVPVVQEKKRLQGLDDHNIHRMALLQVLGRPHGEVVQYLEANGFKAKHLLHEMPSDAYQVHLNARKIR